jgi:hypothetical protein
METLNEQTLPLLPLLLLLLLLHQPSCCGVCQN